MDHIEKFNSCLQYNIFKTGVASNYSTVSRKSLNYFPYMPRRILSSEKKFVATGTSGGKNKQRRQ